ncbi:glycosyltransferase family 4 protein [Microlunatus endophyticus]|nr:glycosyltransferase family 4 protein [Microlunatus endophyticus]
MHRYFHPDTPPYAAILKEIALALGDRGMAVTVLTCQPSYSRHVVGRAAGSEQLAPNVRVRRWSVLPDRSTTALKIVNMIIFILHVVAALLRMKRLDVIMAATNPPVLIASTASLLAKIKRARFVYHLQDIHPEVSVATTGKASIADRVANLVDTWTVRLADRVVVLSDDMAKVVEERGRRDAIMVINNFDPWQLGSQLLPEPKRVDGTIRFVYAGNLGRFQNLETLARAILELRGDDRFAFDFIGDGAMRPWLQRFVTENRLWSVGIHGYVEPRRLAGMMRERFDVGVLSLHPGVIRCAYPSKIMSYLRNGLPVLAVVESDSELIDTLLHRKAGWTADPLRPDAIARAMIEIAESDQILVQMRDNARQMYLDEFDQSHQLRRWGNLFEDLLVENIR